MLRESFERQTFSISAAPEERNFFDQISLTKDNLSHKQFLTSEMIDFEAKNWNGYVTRLMYNCDSDPEIWDFCYIDDKKLEKNGEREGEKYMIFCRGEYCCDMHVLHERGWTDVTEKLD